LTKSKIETKNQQYWRDYFTTGVVPPEAPDYIKKASNIIEYANLSEEEKNVSAILEKARADYDAGFSSAYHDGLEKGKEEGLDISTKIINELLKQTPVDEIAIMFDVSVQMVIHLQSLIKVENIRS